MNFNSLPQLLNYFKDEQTCIEYLEKQRWNNEPICPFCGSKHVYRTNRGFKCANKECHKKFTVTVGTVFENSKIKLSLWFAALYLATAHKKGISSLQLSRDLGITQKTAWFMLHRIREIMKINAPELLTGITEADETFVGRHNKNRHEDKKVKESQGRSVKDKTPVFGLMNNGKVNTTVVKNTKASTLKPIIESMVKSGSILVTDEWHGYNNLSKEYQHKIINHKMNQYSKDGFNTNGIEGFWSLFKRGIYGIYHSASPKHLDRYCNEFTYRFNTRNICDVERFSLSLTNIKGRLTYNRLIKK
jgi:transposase-like protein